MARWSTHEADQKKAGTDVLAPLASKMRSESVLLCYAVLPALLDHKKGRISFRA